jgi:radical SAM-linked protein
MKNILRAMRRAGWPLVFTQGFHPKPRLSFGPACPVGVESRAELLDVHLASSEQPDALLARLGPELLQGVSVVAGWWLEPEEPGIMQAAKAIRYRLRPGTPLDPLRVAHDIDALLARQSWIITRQVKGKTRAVDVRPALLACRVSGANNKAEAVCELAVGKGSAARPREVAQEIFGTNEVQVVREALLFDPLPQRDNP